MFWEAPPGGPVKHRERSAVRTFPWLPVVLVLQAALVLRWDGVRGIGAPKGVELPYLNSGTALVARLPDGISIGIGRLYAQEGVWVTRYVSIGLLLLATVCVFGMARRLYRSGTWAAAVFATAGSVQVAGGLATGTAPAVFLLALAGLLVVGSGRTPWLLIPAAPVAAGMVVFQYTTAVYLPVLCLLAILVSWRLDPLWSLVRGLFLLALTAAFAAAALTWAGTWAAFADALSALTPVRPDTETAARWLGPVGLLAV
ncbi:hypothetical protein, partial [Actinocorallia lasiicapitis]